MSKRFLSTPGEWVTAFGIVITAFSAFAQTLPNAQLFVWLPSLRTFGFAALLGGLAVALREIKDKHAKILEQLVEIQEETKEIAGTARAAIQLGSVVSLIAESLNKAEQQPSLLSHVRAGGKALQHYALKILRDRAVNLQSLAQQGQYLRLIEYNYINDFLTNLADILAMESGTQTPATWFGITRLTEGWLKENAEPGYRDFAEMIQRKSRNKQLCVLRIYVYENDHEFKDIQGHLHDEIQAGITVRTLRWSPNVGEEAPDLTLIWPPTDAFSCDVLRGFPNPVKLFTDKKIPPICGIAFDTTAGRLIKELRVYAPESVEISALQTHFVKAWAMATPYPAATAVTK
jgi:hypothetical protein